MEIPVDKIEIRYATTLQVLGPFGAEYYLWSETRLRLLQRLASGAERRKDAILEDETHAMALDDYPLQDTTLASASASVDLHAICSLLDKFEPLFGEEDTSQLDVTLEWCTPQVAALVETLLAHHHSDFQGIVFVEQRHVATALARLLDRLPQLRGLIRCGDLVGHGMGKGRAGVQGRGMDVQGQQDVVKAFRSGKINLRRCHLDSRRQRLTDVLSDCNICCGRRP
jgi:endoribonuclease Dicer